MKNTAYEDANIRRIVSCRVLKSLFELTSRLADRNEAAIRSFGGPKVQERTEEERFNKYTDEDQYFTCRGILEGMSVRTHQDYGSLSPNDVYTLLQEYTRIGLVKEITLFQDERNLALHNSNAFRIVPSKFPEINTELAIASKLEQELGFL
jgi:hypothetical protein